MMWGSLKLFACVPQVSKSLLSFPTWYQFLPGTKDPVTGACTPELTKLTDVWLVVAAVINILLRLSAILAVFFVIYGGVQYILSQGSPEKTDQARKTIISAMVGLGIAITASLIIGFLASKIG